MSRLSAPEIRALLTALSEELARIETRAEVYVLGGAVMCLVFDARPATKDVDAYFQPSTKVRQAARQVALAHNVPDDWLNDAAKGYLSERGEFAPFLELDHLRVLTATPEYLLAMKCLALRLGAEFHDEADLRFLVRYLNVTEYDEVCAIIGRFYPLERFPQKTFHFLQELFE